MARLEDQLGKGCGKAGEGNDNADEDAEIWEATAAAHAIDLTTPQRPLFLPLKHKQSALSMSMATSTANSSSVSTTTPSSASGQLGHKWQHSTVSSRTTRPTALFAVSKLLADFTVAFRHATSPVKDFSPDTDNSTPACKHRAMQRAEELKEDKLDDAHLIALRDIFQTDVSAADAYMRIKHNGLHKAWVASHLKDVI